MTKEELMKPRYKVIEGYPNMNFNIGEVITLSIGDDERFETAGVKEPYCYHNGNGATSEWELKCFPKIFKPMKWWEERKLEDMPMYIKSNYSNGSLQIGTLAKVKSNGIFEHDTPTDCKYFCKIEGQNNRINYANLLPSTEEEFKNQKNEPLK